MDLANRRVVQELLKQRGIIPRRHWGQNFLVSRPVLLKVVAAADVRPNETILEIGGGLGVLTIELAGRAKKVVVIERDPKLFEILRNNTSSYDNVELQCGDARSFDPSTLGPSPYRLVANLPYGVGTVVLRHLLESKNPPQDSFLILQREVAERIAAKPPHMHLLSLAAQLLAQPKVLFRIPAGAMWPVPDVESALLYLKTNPRPPAERYEKVMAVAKRGFAHPRKYALKNITRDPNVAAHLQVRCRVSKKARAQELTIDQWKCLAATAQLR